MKFDYWFVEWGVVIGCGVYFLGFFLDWCLYWFWFDYDDINFVVLKFDL